MSTVSLIVVIATVIGHGHQLLGLAYWCGLALGLFTGMLRFGPDAPAAVTSLGESQVRILLEGRLLALGLCGSFVVLLIAAQPQPI